MPSARPRGSEAQPELQVNFREYRPDDLEAMYLLDVQCFDARFRFSRRAMRQFAEAEEAVSVIAEDANGIVGFAIAEVAAGAGYIVTIDVAATWRRRGLGRALMLQLEGKARSAGCKELCLHVQIENDPAVRMYEALGYKRSGRKRDFYGRGVDAWAYEKDLA